VTKKLKRKHVTVCCQKGQSDVTAS